jgi:16S rRNA (guanine527-N7)-methyltransferase
VTTPVSRKTPPTPEVARGVFSHTLPKAEQFAALLASDGVLRGLIGPREAPRLWERHLINCALLGEGIEKETDVCDIGSGAGLPGLVLAIRRPDLMVTLVEPLLRRTDFLREAVASLQLDNVQVVRARAAELHGKAEYSIVTSRAVAPLDRLLAWSMPLVRQGGAMLAMKGSTVQEEIGAAREDLRRLGAGEVRVETYGEGLIDPPTTAVRVEATRPSQLGWEAQRRSSPRIVRTPLGKSRRP